MSLGETRPIATLISYMRNHSAVKSVEIEHDTGMRQPEVSTAVGVLKFRGWITSYNEIRAGKGRPSNVYSLSVSVGDIIQEYENRERIKANKQQGKIEKLKSLA